MIAARRQGRGRRLATVAGVLTGLLIPAVAAAHPLGNITINHYAGIEVGLNEIRLDVVIDQAEIPTFEVRSRLDADGDGDLSDAEIAAAREPECQELATQLELKVAGSAATLTSDGADLSFPLGAGLPTTRLACEYVFALPAPIATGGVEIEFSDHSFEEKLGWREIVVQGDATTVEATEGELLTSSPSERLTRYPVDLLTKPLTISSVKFRATPGGGTPSPSATPGGPVPAPDGLPAIFGATDLSPMVALISLLTASALGAFHALTPGHGKTIVAASLVAARGTALHAAGLGLAVTISHTLGILVLAALIVFAQGMLPPEVVASRLPLIAALGIVVVGGWMLVTELRRVRATRTGAGSPHEHPHSAIGRRSLFALGLAGGIVPSTSALLILLGAIAAGRPAFGVVLVVAFGVGMAAVLCAVGVAVVRARGWVDRVSLGSRFSDAYGYLPLGASVAVLLLGVWLTVQALPGWLVG